MVERDCVWCGTTFRPRGSQRTCSIQCRDERLKDYELHRRGKPRGPSIRGPYLRYDQLNPHYWKDLNDPDKCWLLGFIATDGDIQPYMTRFHLQRADEEILHIIKALLGSWANIEPTPTGTSFKISCREWSKDLTQLGVGQAKSRTVRWIDTPFPWDYLRGLLDGDGSVFVVSETTPVMEFASSSFDMIEGFVKHARGQGYDPRVRKRDDLSEGYQQVVFRVDDVRDILPRIYYHQPYVQRKYDRVIKALG